MFKQHVPLITQEMSQGLSIKADRWKMEEWVLFPSGCTSDVLGFKSCATAVMPPFSITVHLVT